MGRKKTIILLNEEKDLIREGIELGFTLPKIAKYLGYSATWLRKYIQIEMPEYRDDIRRNGERNR